LSVEGLALACNKQLLIISMNSLFASKACGTRKFEGAARGLRIEEVAIILWNLRLRIVD